MKHTLTLLAALLLALTSALHAADASKPNVLFIISDDMNCRLAASRQVGGGGTGTTRTRLPNECR